MKSLVEVVPEGVRTPAGVMRVLTNGRRPIVHHLVLEIGDSRTFPDCYVGEDPEGEGRTMLQGVARTLAGGVLRKAGTAASAGHVDTFVEHVRSWGEDAAFSFASDDEDDRRHARERTARALAFAAVLGDPYRAARSFERDTGCGEAGVGLVYLFRDCGIMERAHALALDPETWADAAVRLERASFSRSRMLAGLVRDLRGTEPEPVAPAL